MDDQKLLRLLHKDPNAGMEKLIDTYAGLVYAVIARVFPDPGALTSELEGCAADVFSDFYFSLDRYDPRLSSIKTYLCVIARNNAVDLLRKNDRLRAHVSPDGGDFALQLRDDASVEEAVLEKELRQEVLQAIHDLGEPDCTIVLRKFFWLQPSKQIAKDLGLTVSNVDTRTHRAIAKLRKLFGGTGA